MKLFYILGGSIIILISFALLINTADELEIFQKGKKVNVIITYVPIVFINNDVTYNFRFEYKGKEYSKMISDGCCNNLKAGDNLPLIYYEAKDRFLFENKNPMTGFIFIIILLGLGIYSIYKGLKAD